MIDVTAINSKVKVRVKVVVGKVALSLKQLSEMQTGTILELDRNVDDLVDVYVNDVLAAKGRLFTDNGELGVKIVEFAGNEESA